ncbi:unnamed protein product [Amoebophrya sp. A25]|nr:unnamed protein product [Amoebophrya sp. A25]|eukprot:GSA25T00020594001.1
MSSLELEHRPEVSRAHPRRKSKYIRDTSEEFCFAQEEGMASLYSSALAKRNSRSIQFCFERYESTSPDIV